jgi:phosphatidylinositol alpha 1,6-mannosyltransferase
LDTLLTAESRSIETRSLAPGEITQAVRRVALFTEAFLPKVDGVSRTALLTVRYLECTGRELIVFAPAPTPHRVGRTPVYSIPSLWLPDYPETRVALPWPFLLARLHRFRPDLIHLFSPFSLGMMGMIAGHVLDVPIIANYQTDLPAYVRTYGAGYLRQTFIGALRFIHNGCYLNLAPSTATLRELREWHFRRLQLWERGVDSERFSPARRDETWRARLLAGRDPSRLVALYVGRMAKEKHLATLREIAHEPGVALTLIGGGNYQASVQHSLREAGGDPHFIGHLLGDDLANAFAAADVFVFPGPEETFGQVVLEAMASGLPVIVTARGGPTTLVKDGENGFICPVDDAAAFNDRVRCLRDDPARRLRMGQAARRDAERRPWMAVMRQLETYYASVICTHERLRRLR